MNILLLADQNLSDVCGGKSGGVLDTPREAIEYFRSQGLNPKQGAQALLGEGANFGDVVHALPYTV